MRNTNLVVRAGGPHFSVRSVQRTSIVRGVTLPVGIQTAQREGVRIIYLSLEMYEVVFNNKVGVDPGCVPVFTDHACSVKRFC